MAQHIHKYLIYFSSEAISTDVKVNFTVFLRVHVFVCVYISGYSGLTVSCSVCVCVQMIVSFSFSQEHRLSDSSGLNCMVGGC